MSMFVARLLKLAPAMQLREKCRLAAVHAPCFLLSCQTPLETFKLKSLPQFTVQILLKLIVVLTLDPRETPTDIPTPFEEK